MTELLLSIKQISQKKNMYGFEAFVIEEFAGGEAKSLPYPERQQAAWKNFVALEREAAKSGVSGRCLKVSAKTKKRWFGINGESYPKRFQLFQMAYELEMSPEETERYLKTGLQQPGIQYNDYREWLYLYGLQNKIPFQQIQQKIYQFEAQMDAEQVFEQTSHTNWLKKCYLENKTLPMDEFFLWMSAHVRLFKGYSRTALHYFEVYRDEVLKILRQEERKELRWLLETTDYEEWKQGWLQSATKEQLERAEEDKDQWEQDMVRRYVKHASRRRNALPSGFCRDILNTARLAYGHGNLHYMLSSLYPDELKKNRMFFSAMGRMSDKQASYLLHIAEHKENEMRVSQEAATEEQPAVGTKKGKKQKDAERRVILLGRSHLLPLIHYVAQAKYRDRINEAGTEYCQADAITCFTDMANAVLLACGMEEISEEFILDCVLLSCFQTEDMFQISEVIELLEQCID